MKTLKMIGLKGLDVLEWLVKLPKVGKYIDVALTVAFFCLLGKGISVLANGVSALYNFVF